MKQRAALTAQSEALHDYEAAYSNLINKLGISDPSSIVQVFLDKYVSCLQHNTTPAQCDTHTDICNLDPLLFCLADALSWRRPVLVFSDSRIKLLMQKLLWRA